MYTEKMKAKALRIIIQSLVKLDFRFVLVIHRKDVGKRYGGEKSVKNTKVWDAAKIHNGMIEFTDRMSLQDCFLCLHKRRVNGYRLKVFLR